MRDDENKNATKRSKMHSLVGSGYKRNCAQKDR